MVLAVNTIAATGVPDAATRGETSGDPYVVVKLLECEEGYQGLEDATSRAEGGEGEIAFGGSLTLKLPMGSPRPAKVQVALWDEDRDTPVNGPYASADYVLETDSA